MRNLEKSDASTGDRTRRLSIGQKGYPARDQYTTARPGQHPVWKSLPSKKERGNETERRGGSNAQMLADRTQERPWTVAHRVCNGQTRRLADRADRF